MNNDCVSNERKAPPCFTKEQTEALKRFVGMDEFYPSLWEVQQAGKIFKAKLSTLAQDVTSGETTIDTAINSAAAAVWSQARRYQSEKQTAQAAAKHDKPSVFRKLLHFLPNSRTKKRSESQ